MSYSKYTNEEILDTYNTTVEYASKADKALVNEIQVRGGIEAIRAIVREKNIAPDEQKRIAKEVAEYYKKGIEFDFIKSNITSDILNPDQVEKVIERALANIKAHKQDTAITSKTIVLCLVGMLISTTICSFVWYYSIINTGRMYYFLTAIFLVISFSIIRAITKQSAKNVLVFLATFFSAFFALIFGTMLYHFTTTVGDIIYG